MEISHLDVKSIPNEAVILALGRRKSGKSVNIASILYAKRDVFEFGLVFCGSTATKMEYEKIIPKRFIYDGVDINVLTKLVNMQEEAVKNGTVRPVFVVADDVGYDSVVFRSKIFRRLFMNGRHAKIFFIMSLQYSMGIRPALRGQIDYVFASLEKNQTYRRKIFEHYSVAIKRFSVFDELMCECTKNFETFVLSVCSSNSQKISKNIFYYKSIYPTPEFRMASNKSWWQRRKKVKTQTIGAPKKISLEI